MTFDVAAAQRLAAEASRIFSEGLQQLVTAAEQEAARERARLETEANVLARERLRLEEAWKQLNVEKQHFEANSHCTSALTTGLGLLVNSPKKTVAPESEARHDPITHHAEAQPALASSRAGPVLSEVDQRLWKIGAPLGQVPKSCVVPVGGRLYSVLPLEEPGASGLGHDLWNHTVEVPDGWEVLSSVMDGFSHAISALTQHRWGAMVLGVQNDHDGFDAYWTPLFNDGSNAGQCCEADVDWIEPAQDSGRHFRMTYSGLRLAIRSKGESATPGASCRSQASADGQPARAPLQRVPAVAGSYAPPPAQALHAVPQHLAMPVAPAPGNGRLVMPTGLVRLPVGGQ